MDALEPLLRFNSSTLTETAEQAAVAALLESLTAGDLARLAMTLAGNRESLEIVARHAYRHVNGFQKVTLLKTSQLCLRAHLWDGTTFPAENIHSHKWAFASRLAVGELQESRFEIDDDAPDVTEYEYSKSPDSLVGRLVPTVDRSLALVDQLSHAEGSVYSVNTSAIHQVHAAKTSDLMISVVLTGRSRLPKSNVYAPIGSLPMGDRDTAFLGLDATEDALRRFAWATS